MNKENASKLWKIIQEAGDYLAHVAICVKNKFNSTYKDIPDDKFDEVINYIKFLKENPS